MITDKYRGILLSHYGSMGEAAKRIGVSPTTLSNCMNDDRKRRNLLRYMPEVIRDTGVEVTDLYNAIMKL